MKETTTVAVTLQRMLYVKIVNEGMTASEATESVISDWETLFVSIDDEEGKVDQLLGLVRPLVNDKAKRIYRNHTRQLENRVFSDQPLVVKKVNPLTGAVSDSEEFMNWHEAQKRLLERSFNLPNGKWVRYSDSTPEDHEMRANWQLNRADSIQQDADRHQALADLMRAHNAETLGDLDVNIWRGILSSQ